MCLPATPIGASPLVSIVIANWNGRSWLAQCLPTLQRQTFTDFEIIIVDNGSTDGSVAWLTDNWPDVRVIPLKMNLGFAAANNVGMRAARGRFIVTLNNDTLAEPDWLAAMVTAVAAPDVGMVAAKILVWNNPDVLDSTGIEVDVTGTAWNRGDGLPADTLFSAEVFGPSGAAALYRREMLAQIGLFDEDFFAYYEDVDLAWRARRAGWRCVYAAEAQINHWHSATGGQNLPLKAFFLGRNRVWCLLKNYAWPTLLWTAPLLLFYDTLAGVAQSLRLRDIAPLHGRWQAWLTARHMWRKRIPEAHSVSLHPPQLLQLPGRFLRSSSRSPLRPTSNGPN